VSWPAQIYAALKAARVRQVAYVPDAGHGELLRLAHADPTMTPVLLTSEEEGVGVLAGAWLGGERAVLLMQSSGVGNCVNALSLIPLLQLPFLAIVTMRGEWGEFNPWQIPMGSATPDAFALMGVRSEQVTAAEDVAPTVQAAAAQVFEGGGAVAVLLGQRLIGSKEFLK
jgi:sulfopyruvate decarboxylase alpha subunit